MLYSELANNAISDGMVSFASKEGSASVARFVRMPYDTRPLMNQDTRILKTTFTTSEGLPSFCPLFVTGAMDISDSSRYFPEILFPKVLSFDHLFNTHNHDDCFTYETMSVMMRIPLTRIHHPAGNRKPKAFSDIMKQYPKRMWIFLFLEKNDYYVMSEGSVP